MTPEQIEIERKAFAEWAAEKAFLPTSYMMWLIWLARAEKAEQVREALEKMLAACPEGNDGLLGRHIRVMPDLIEACRAARAALKENTHG